MQSQIKLVSIKDIFRHEDHASIEHYLVFLEDNLKSFINNRNTKPITIKFNDIKNVWDTDYDDDDNIASEIFDFAKLHWLIHDIKQHGVSFSPQAFTIWDEEAKKFHLNAHPGTYRFYAIIHNNMLSQEILLLDTKNFFPNIESLTQKEIKKIINKGFLRNRDTYTEISIERESQMTYTEYHESDNHHDVNIKINYEELMKIYKDDITIFLPYGVSDNVLYSLKEYNFKIKNLENISKAEFYIPSICDFKGIGIFLDLKTNMDLKKYFSPTMLYSLDTIDDLAYTENQKVIIFNNRSIGCRRLIPGIVKESKTEYLNKFMWTKKTTRILQNEI